MDWSGCQVVERVPGKVGGVPVLRRSRVPADSVWENLQDATAEEVAEMFDLDLADVKALHRHAEAHGVVHAR